MNRMWDRLLATVLVACALLVTGLVVHREFWGSSTAPLRRISPLTDWKRFRLPEATIGSSSAEVTIVEFSDFQCSFCKRVSKSVATVRAKYGDRVAWTFRHYPLELSHPAALDAALAAECARDQGRFEQMHGVLFEVQESLGQRPWGELAIEAGVVDTVRHRECQGRPDILARIRRDQEAAEELNISGTPLLLVNDTRINGFATAAELDSLVADALGRR